MNNLYQITFSFIRGMDEAEFLKAIGKHLRKLRKHKKVSLRELELRGDVSRHILSEIENGKRDIRITTLKKIMYALNLSEKEFWEDFKSISGSDLEDLITDSVKQIVKFLPSHNETIHFRNLLQEVSDQLADKVSHEEISRFLLIKRMELHDCLNQEGLRPEQEKLFLNIKKKVLARLDEEQSKLNK